MISDAQARCLDQMRHTKHHCNLEGWAFTWELDARVYPGLYRRGFIENHAAMHGITPTGRAALKEWEASHE
jgi:hypothetical protein